MTLIKIPGMTQDALLNRATESKGGGLKPFPCDANGWTKHTAVVLKCEIKAFDFGDEHTENISILVGNAEFGGEVLINLDPTRVAPNCTNPEKVQQQNLESLLRAIKILDCATNGQLDTAKLEKAHGQVVEIIAKHKGFRQHEGRYYHKVTLLLTGTAPDLTPVTGTLPALPGAAPAVTADPLDILF